MLHLFDGSDESEQGDDFGLSDFNRPVIGEGKFTQWVSSTGALRGPDHFRKEDRRAYRFLPDLPWAMFLGPQFNGRYDPILVQKEAFRTSQLPQGLLVQSTRQFGDLLVVGGNFDTQKSAIKRCFPGGFFRR